MNTQKHSKTIKIAHILNNLGPAGKELGILKLVERLDSKIFDTTLVVLNLIKTRGALDLSRYQIIHINSGQGNNVQTPFQLAKIFRENKFDVVHTHSWGTLVEGVVGAKLAKTPVIIHGEHGTFPEKFPHSYVQRFFWGRADRVLSVSKILKDRLSSVTGFPNQKIDVILNGVNDGKFFPDQNLRNEFRQKFNFKEDDLILGTVGRLHEIKNQAMIIRAAAILQQQGVKVKTVFVGSGTTADKRRKELDNLALELGVTSNIHFLGFNKEINMILNGIDVFALTSLKEGCSNVIQEAMCAGKPVVATKVGGNPELINDGETGILVESNNHLQLSEAVNMLINNPVRRKEIGLKARAYALNTFSLQQMVKSYERVYSETLNHKLR